MPSRSGPQDSLPQTGQKCQSALPGASTGMAALPSKSAALVSGMKSERFHVLNERFGFSEFREGQEEIIEAVVAGQDVLAVMPTGSGKSLCYQLPALLFPGVTLVVSPLIALMKDQVDALERRQIPASFINSTLSFAEQQQRITQMREGHLKLVYVAPERFRNRRFMDGLQGCPVSLLAVDEAHCVSEWGHDFRPDYLRLKEAIARLQHPCVVALTATATPEVRRDIVDQLGLQSPATFVTGFDRPNLCFRVQEVSGEPEKLEAIRGLLSSGMDRGIIYAATRKNVEKVTTELCSSGYRIGSYHAGMELDARKATQDRFMRGELPVVAATNAFGMGIDKADVRFIVHYDVPGSLEAYYQEVGRAGRDGQPATCLLLFNFADTFTQEFFIEGNCPPPELIKDVYQTVCSFRADDVEVTVRELAVLSGHKKANEMAVASSLKLLERAGYIERGTEGQHQARVTLRENPDKLREEAAAKGLQRSILDYCLEVLRAKQGETRRIDLSGMANDLELSVDQLRRGLSALHQAGQLAYEAPFRGRGIRVLQRVQVHRLEVNYAAVERRGQFERRKLRKMVDYAYSQSCLRRFILDYFGESVSHLQCGNCSRCLKAVPAGRLRPLNDSETILVKKCLSCAARMKGRYGKMRLAQVLTGSRLKVLDELQLTRLSTYGLLKEFTQPEVLSVLDALIGAGLLEVEGAEYPLVRLTDRGRGAMLGQVPIEMVFPLVLPDESGTRVQKGPDTASNAAAPFHQELFAALREKRRTWAERLNLPPFVIFHDETLKNISRFLPQTLTELGKVKGIGTQKLEAYGLQVVDLVQEFLKKYPESHPLPISEQPEAPKTVRQVTDTIEETWRLWKLGKTADQIATVRGLARSTVIVHLETLILDGRVVDVTRFVSPTRIALISDAIAQVQGDRLTPIKALLPEEVTFEEIRLVKAAAAVKRTPRQGSGK
ncbi:MAG: RecQ family ATP-dependent DNA helicase [Acidobacteria bacterium]|nr:RecQ family ATP-dependent DNA helicase [Acidobacteriota bacterium]